MLAAMQRKAATAALKGIVPHDPLEGMLAAQLLATHKGAIGSFHHANPCPSREPGRQLVGAGPASDQRTGSSCHKSR